MKSDFSRSTYNSLKHFRSVRMQQGRVQVDADWNEQLDIAEHRESALLQDAIGTTGVPGSDGFAIGTSADRTDLTIGPGRIYVGGILCENEASLAFTAQSPADFPGASSIGQTLKTAGTSFALAYLDVWPRQITALEDDSIREKALGGPDTATRVKNIWQAKVFPLVTEQASLANLQILLLKEAALVAELPAPPNQISHTQPPAQQFSGNTAVWQSIAAVESQIDDAISSLTYGDPATMAVVDPAWKALVSPAASTLTARLSPSGIAASACELLPQSGYQRLENQLYRIEIHDPGTAATATFKWSRENGSVVVRWLAQDTLRLTVSSTGRGAPLSFNSGDWVELFDDSNDLLNQPGLLVQIATVEGNVLVLQTLPASVTVDFTKFPRNPRIRRWDQTSASGPVPVAAPSGGDGFSAIEGGIEIQFAGNSFRSGDFWWIPARTALSDTQVGGIEWPQDTLGNALAQQPTGIAHQYAELALIYSDAQGKLQVLADYRQRFPALTELNQLFYVGGNGQSGSPGQTLTEPLQVGVSRGQHPVSSALVRFTVVSGGGQLSKEGLPIGTGSTLIVRTGADGLATVDWQPGPIDQPQRVEAMLLGPDLLERHLPVFFTSSFADAPGGQLRITDLRMGSGYPLRNASHVLNSELQYGFRVICNQPISELSLQSTLTCGIFLYLPFPMAPISPNFNSITIPTNPTQVPFWGYQPFLLVGSVDVDPTNPSAFMWIPDAPSSGVFLAEIWGLVANVKANALPVELRIRGNFIFGKNSPNSVLSASVFNSPNGMQLPSGDLHPGGDLQFFFTLVQSRPAYDPAHIFRIEDLSTIAYGIGTHLL